MWVNERVVQREKVLEQDGTNLWYKGEEWNKMEGTGTEKFRMSAKSMQA